MMNKEEKKAISELKHFSNETPYWKQEEYSSSEVDSYIKIVLNLIEKQQKEIEELKNIDLTIVYMDGLFDGEKKLKDKLREIIKEKAKTDTYNFKTIDIKDLEEILGE